jgi:hypothetical protein
MVINKNIKQKRVGGKCCSPVLLQGKIAMCWAGKPKNIMMSTDGWENLRKGGDEHHEQFSNTESQRVGRGVYSLGTKLR